MAIINYEEENPEGNGAINKGLYIAVHNEKANRTKEQKVNQSHITRNKRPMISKEKRQSSGSN